MDHSVILQYIQALGFPICVSIALFYALWKIGGRLVEAFFDHVQQIGPKLDRIADATEATRDKLGKWPSDLVDAVSDSVHEKMAAKFKEMGCKPHEISLLLEESNKRRGVKKDDRQ